MDPSTITINLPMETGNATEGLSNPSFSASFVGPPTFSVQGHGDFYYTKSDLSTLNPYDPVDTIYTLFGGVNARVDWRETHDEHVIKVDVPGLKKHQVKVDIEDGRVLRISGEMKRDDDNNTHKWHYAERGTGKFDRKFTLPENAKVEELKAGIEDGVLTVTMPKAKSDVRSVQISG